MEVWNIDNGHHATSPMKPTKSTKQNTYHHSSIYDNSRRETEPGKGKRNPYNSVMYNSATAHVLTYHSSIVLLYYLYQILMVSGTPFQFVSLCILRKESVSLACMRVKASFFFLSKMSRIHLFGRKINAQCCNKSTTTTPPTELKIKFIQKV